MMQKALSLVLSFVAFVGIRYGVEVADKKVLEGNVSYNYEYIVSTVEENLGLEGNGAADAEMQQILSEIENVWREYNER